MWVYDETGGHEVPDAAPESAIAQLFWNAPDLKAQLEGNPQAEAVAQQVLVSGGADTFNTAEMYKRVMAGMGVDVTQSAGWDTFSAAEKAKGDALRSQQMQLFQQTKTADDARNNADQLKNTMTLGGAFMGGLGAFGGLSGLGIGGGMPGAGVGDLAAEAGGQAGSSFGYGINPVSSFIPTGDIAAEAGGQAGSSFSYPMQGFDASGGIGDLAAEAGGQAGNSFSYGLPIIPAATGAAAGAAGSMGGAGGAGTGVGGAGAATVGAGAAASGGAGDIAAEAGGQSGGSFNYPSPSAAAGTGVSAMLANALGISPTAAAALLTGGGALLGGLGASGDPAGTTTTTTGVADWQKPYITGMLDDAKKIYTANQSNPIAANLANSGAANLQSTINGDYLNPGSNPYLQGTYNTAATKLTDNFNSTIMPQLNRAFGNMQAFGGNSAYSELLGNASKGLGYGLADLGNQIYGGNYQAERGRQYTGALGANDYAQGYSQTPYANLAAYGAIAGRPYGSQTNTPYFSNTTGGALSGALAGGVLSGLFGKG